MVSPVAFECDSSRAHTGCCSHRHVRWALFFHCLAMIEVLRSIDIMPAHDDFTARERADRKARYEQQLTVNHAFISKWASASPVNAGMWVALIDAELASLQNRPDAFQLYDTAVSYAIICFACHICLPCHQHGDPARLAHGRRLGSLSGMCMCGPTCLVLIGPRKGAITCVSA
jgi:hypothetical protein